MIDPELLTNIITIQNLMVKHHIIQLKLPVGIELVLHPSAFAAEPIPDTVDTNLRAKIGDPELNGEMCRCGCSEDEHSNGGLCLKGHTPAECFPELPIDEFSGTSGRMSSEE